ncbi:MAG TPA: hypothetical protein IAA18_08620 [Candidatus Pseudomonas excrementavium]|uniref:hypothetical protein n=1 Tax=Halopseudomonas bauzanensis TaxID=653930 RepID=UPI001C3B0BFA|nr:hypothetical protein [Halopseudomonas bauzanensis]HIZ51133.1 hypothetical protein [Candidatus Pseudomonas excrementavium]
MKMKRWPFWPVFAMVSLITLVAAVEVNSATGSQLAQCSSSSMMCGAPTVTINRLFIP